MAGSPYGTPRHLPRLLGAAMLLAVIGPARLPAADPPADAAIRAASAAFVEAFNRGDVRQLASLWSADGSLALEQGTIIKGRAAIENHYAAFFKEFPGAKIEDTIRSIQFPTPTVAVEDGVSQIVSQHAGPPTASRYTAVYVLEGGQWLMSSVRETSINVPSSFAHLQDLQWLVGRWMSRSGDTTIEVQFRWIASKSYLQREHTTGNGGLATSSGTQVIGWDPRASRLRSWSFDSTGAHNTGVWTATPEGWRIQTEGTQADGTSASSIDCLIRVPQENDVFGWRSIDRKFGGVAFPNTPEIVFDRQNEKK